jgi:hypothetical protein
VVGVLLFGVLFAGVPGPGTIDAQSRDPVQWTEFNVDFDVRPDGTVHVTETQVIRFTGGPYRSAFAEISMARVEDIDNVVVAQIDDAGNRTDFRRVRGTLSPPPGTYYVAEDGGMLLIEFFYEPAIDETRTFVLEYDLTGAIRVYEELDPPNLQFWWTAISAGTTEAAPVVSSTVTITLPEVVDVSDVVILGEDGQAALDPNSYTDDGRTFTWRAEDFDAGEELDVRLQFPVIIDIAKPDWQEADDARRERAEKDEERQDLYTLIVGAIGVLVAIVGSVLLYGLWYTRGRDPQVGLVASFLPEPPDDSPPGTVGVLVDEHAEERDLVATLIDLSRRGVFRIEEQTTKQQPDLRITLLQPEAPMSELEKALTNDLFDNKLDAGKSVTMGQNPLTHREKVMQGLYGDLVQRGYYTRSPEITRATYRQRGTILMFGSIVLYFIVSSQLDIGPIFFPFAVLTMLGMVLRWQSRHMPRRTEQGAEAAARWRAFRTYLTDIQKYENLEESTETFDRYLSFAIAFGIEKSWVDKFAKARTPAPPWLGPGGTVIVLDNDRGRRPSQHLPRTDGGGLFDWLDPSQGDSGGGTRSEGGGLQGTSDRAARGLQGSSDSLVSMLNTAGRAFGGFGGGSGSRRSGSFGSFGGGGSRGGFSGGGSRGGGGGGGRRGFR